MHQAYTLSGTVEAMASVALLVWGVPAVTAVPRFHYGLLAGAMGDPQLYYDAPTNKFHIFPQYSPQTKPPYAPKSAPPTGPMGWGHGVSVDLVGDFTALPIPFGPEALSAGTGIHTAAGTGCTLRINTSHVGSLVNGEGGWETTNNYAAVVRSDQDPRLVNWTEVSHGIQGNHSDPHAKEPWIGDPGNHIPQPFGLIGNVVAWHNGSRIFALVSTSVGDPRVRGSLPAFMRYSSADFAAWVYEGPFYTHPTPMCRAECGDFFPIGPGSEGVTAANVDFGLAAPGCRWVLMWSTPDHNAGGLARNAGVVYLVGKLVAGAFVPTSPVQAAEYGSGFYASQTVLSPTDGRVIMDDLGGGVQSIPRAVTLNSDQSLRFEPVAAVAARHTGTPLAVRSLALAAGANYTVPQVTAYGDALDLIVTVRNGSGSVGERTGDGGARVNNASAAAVIRVGVGADATPRCRCTHASPWCCREGPVEISVRAGAADVSAGGRVVCTGLPLVGDVARIRVVVDQQVVEIFGGGTPLSFMYMPLDGGRGVAVEGPGVFDIYASEVLPATVKYVGGR